MIIPSRDDAAGNTVIAVDRVTRRFGNKTALDNVSLTLAQGTVLGLVGENGAGKTTLIKHILGLLKPGEGTVRVFGKDPTVDPVGVLSRIGYLSESDDYPPGMRVGELMRYTQSFYPGWDTTYAERLRQDFGLDLGARLRDLSKGQRARAGLLVALAYRPDLLVLDEPSSGLDPLVRRDILGAIIQTIAGEGRTVLFSSHLLGEVERVADRIAMVQNGRILFCDTIEAIKEAHRRIQIRFAEPRFDPPSIEATFAWEGSERNWSAVCAGNLASFEASVALIGGAIVDEQWSTLDEIFVAHSGRRSLVDGRAR